MSSCLYCKKCNIVISVKDEECPNCMTSDLATILTVAVESDIKTSFEKLVLDISCLDESSGKDMVAKIDGFSRNSGLQIG